ncbi:hypothetical protein BDY21DRAFT_425020 [Lineolata rhizophorae]|uniref:Uncharacterized protein n=1 Tax=Lineolata rhizophorae TaxID=578093 RepID=A0A6A6NMC9_9PEZI|nr:hypothetical protein BDY21DRAFT_425020 [Lineolata rhizophorae]
MDGQAGWRRWEVDGGCESESSSSASAPRLPSGRASWTPCEACPVVGSSSGVWFVLGWPWGAAAAAERAISSGGGGGIEANGERAAVCSVAEQKKPRPCYGVRRTALRSPTTCWVVRASVAAPDVARDCRRCTAAPTRSYLSTAQTHNGKERYATALSCERIFEQKRV